MVFFLFIKLTGNVMLKCYEFAKLIKDHLTHLCMPHWYGVRLGVMVLIATFNNISAVSWRPVLLVEETRVHEENHRPASSHWQTLSHRHDRNSNSQR